MFDFPDLSPRRFAREFGSFGRETAAAIPGTFEYDACRIITQLQHSLHPDRLTMTPTMPISTRMLRQSFLVAALIAALFASSGCVYRLTILQGNFLEPKDLDRVAVGMTRIQVRALLGTPMVADPFQSSRWDYVYYYRLGKSGRTGQRQFTVYFDTDDKVVRIDRVDEKKPQPIDHPVERQIAG